jgi:hypothetical protein
MRTVTPVPVFPTQDASEGAFELSLVLQLHDEVISPTQLSSSVVSRHRGLGAGLIMMKGHEKKPGKRFQSAACCFWLGV